MSCEPARVLGLVLAAGAGARYGEPKALVEGWLPDRVAALADGGCDRILVVLGAAADRARALVPAGVGHLVVRDWAEGMGASLRAGLTAARAECADAVLIALVDTPGLTAEAVGRVIGAGAAAGGLTEALAQASYLGQRGHPVLIGRSHWAGVAQVSVGDRGARDYLRGREVVVVECGDVASGRDVDAPPDPGSDLPGTRMRSRSDGSAAEAHPNAVF